MKKQQPSCVALRHSALNEVYKLKKKKRRNGPENKIEVKAWFLLGDLKKKPAP